LSTADDVLVDLRMISERIRSAQLLVTRLGPSAAMDARLITLGAQLREAFLRLDIILSDHGTLPRSWNAANHQLWGPPHPIERTPGDR
jgi:hypothetical protein